MLIDDMLERATTVIQARCIRDAEYKKNFRKYCEGFYSGLDEYDYHNDHVQDCYERAVKRITGE